MGGGGGGRAGREGEDKTPDMFQACISGNLYLAAVSE